MHSDALFISLVVFLPALAALALAFFPKDKPEAIKLTSLAVTIAVFAMTLWMAFPAGSSDGSAKFSAGIATMQNAFSSQWIPSFNIYYFMGMDGISFTLVLLTSFVSMLSM